jgi:chromosome partitioning protein
MFHVKRSSLSAAVLADCYHSLAANWRCGVLPLFYNPACAGGGDAPARLALLAVPDLWPPILDLSSMPRVICIANQKGGVGKTTTALNLACAIAMAGERTLLVDLDPQCNATTGLGLDPDARHALVDSRPLRESFRDTYLPNLSLLPGARSFEDVDALANSSDSRSLMLATHLSGSLGSFDAVLIDCPPSVGALTRTALASASEVLMPIQCEYFAMEGLTQMIEVIKQVIGRSNSRLQFGGILLTMYDATLELTAEVDREVRDFFGGIVFSTVIPRDAAVSEAPSHGQSVIDYAPRSRGARAYVELCQEVLERV